MSGVPLQYPAPNSRLSWRNLLDKLRPLLGVTFVFALFALLVPLKTGRHTFVTLSNLELMLRLTAVVGTAAIGMALIIIAGGIDLSAGPVIALTTVIIALLLQHGCSAASSECGEVVPASICGLIPSQTITRLKLPPFIAT